MPAPKTSTAVARPVGVVWLSRMVASGRRRRQAPPVAPARGAIRPQRASMAGTRRTTTGLVGMEAASAALDTARSGPKASLCAR